MSVPDRTGGVDNVYANEYGMSRGAFLKLIQTKALWLRKKQMQTKEKTNAICQNRSCIEGSADS